jgi:hypothetical protein
MTTTIAIQSSSSELSKGALAGIVIGSVVGSAVLLALGVLLYRHQPNKVPSPRVSLIQQPAEKQEAHTAGFPSGRLQYPPEVMEQPAAGGRLRQEEL